jgi:hypothetical protein
VLLSAEGAAGFLGPRAWRALVGAAAVLAPGARSTSCSAAATRPGMRSLRCGRGAGRWCSMAARPPGPVAAAAAECGARLLPARPPRSTCDGSTCAAPAAAAILAQWLAAAPDDSRAAGG